MHSDPTQPRAAVSHHLFVFKTIIPAEAWFYVSDPLPSNKEPAVWRLAAWGLTESNRVIGLVPEENRGARPPSLVAVPPVPGAYRHGEDLTPAQRERIACTPSPIHSPSVEEISDD